MTMNIMILLSVSKNKQILGFTNVGNEWLKSSPRIYGNYNINSAARSLIALLFSRVHKTIIDNQQFVIFMLCYLVEPNLKLTPNCQTDPHSPNKTFW